MATYDSDKAAHRHRELHSHLPSEPALRLKALVSKLAPQNANRGYGIVPAKRTAFDCADAIKVVLAGIDLDDFPFEIGVRIELENVAFCELDGRNRVIPIATID